MNSLRRKQKDSLNNKILKKQAEEGMLGTGVWWTHRQDFNDKQKLLPRKEENTVFGPCERKTPIRGERHSLE